ncbi:MAG: DNA polymerase III subunit delta' [Luminiphilus sp.]|nr:DNA polymerase III subunit delta' [Luminiphilus sp.]
MRSPELLKPWLNSALPWQQSILERLSSLEHQKKLPHAILLTGAKGLGKTQLAASFATGLLCQRAGVEPCGSCTSCQLAGGGAHGDFRWIAPEEGKRAIGVDAIRAAVTFMQQTSGYGSHKVLVIQPAEAMTAAAANALLKTLEEPPGKALLILVSHRPGELPATVRSRCQRYNLPHPSRPVALTWLANQSSCSGPIAEQAYSLAQAQPLTALRLILNEDLATKAALIDALSGLLEGSKTTPEALAGFSGYDLDVILDTALQRVEERIYYAAGEPGSKAHFRQRDKILEWLIANRKGINFGRDVILPELARLLVTEA